METVPFDTTNKAIPDFASPVLQADASGIYHPTIESDIQLLIAEARKAKVQIRVVGAAQSRSNAIYTDNYLTTPRSADINIMWDNVSAKLPISTDFDSRVMVQIKNALRDNRPYFQAAMYYMENNKDLNKALGWLDKAIEQNPNAFWVYHQKANALAKLGKKQDAITTANKSIELAKAAQNDDYVALNQKLIASLK